MKKKTSFLLVMLTCLGLILNPGLVIADTLNQYNLGIVKSTSTQALPLPSNIGGTWETVPLPPDPKDWIQAVHTTLLPNGKVLIVNGSSNRNTLDQPNGTGRFIDGVNVSDYNTINNSALFDPQTKTFERIASPLAIQNGQTNDPFCSANVHLSDGNVLFVSGSNRYYPGEKFEGSKQTNVYNWVENKWTSLGSLKEGRWYPSPITLADGTIVIFSGLKFNAPNQITPSIEIYDPVAKTFQYIDLTYIENSPFNTKFTYEDKYTFNGQPVSRIIDAYDSIDLYPRVFPTADGRLLITGDGAGKFPLEKHETNKTYLMTVTKNSLGKYSVSFEVGPDRKEISKVYGTGLLDPNYEGDVLLLGGIIGTNDINFGRPYLGSANDEAIARGVRISASLERWSSPKNSQTTNGEWKLYTDFFSKPHAMGQAVILPTKQILVVNGGEYGEYKAIHEPLLLSPDIFAPGGYRKETLNPGKFPRLYHNNALLLPDARVLVIGGNVSRAARQKDGIVRVDVLPDPANYYIIPQLKDSAGNPQIFDLNTYYQDPNAYRVDGDPEPFVPAEIWQAEIFTPPYLYTSSDRPVIAQAPEQLQYGGSNTISVVNGTSKASVTLVKLSTSTHSFDYGQRLADLQIEAISIDNSSLSFKAPTNPNLYPPGYYMLFYVNDTGTPSQAKIVKLGA